MTTPDDWDHACHRCGQVRCGCITPPSLAYGGIDPTSAARWVVEWARTPQWNRWPMFLAMGISMRGWLQSLKAPPR